MPEIQKVRNIHDAIIDTMIAAPTLSQGELAKQFGYTQGWMSIILNSDSFRDALKRRREEIIDPKLLATVEDRLTAVANKAMERMLERLDLSSSSISNGELTKMVEVTTKGLGLGPQSRQPVLQQNLYVIPAPQRPANSKEWAQIVENESGR